jgi:threonine dehydrogenase-like Zn-dependent dehydrogenase
MKALTILEPTKAEFIDVPEPEPGEEGVLIKIHYLGLCGSDLKIYRGSMPMQDYPRIPGHEISGIIAAKGKNVPEDFAIGEKVMVSPYTHCGVCPACRIGRTNTCQFNETYGVQRDGALTQMVAVHYSKVYSSKILSLKELALVEPLSVGYHAANRGQVTEVDDVLIIGCGAIGMGAISACVRKGATVIVADIDDDKLAQAKALGAHHLLNSEKIEVSDAVAELTSGKGVGVAIEAAGAPHTYQLAVDVVSFAGRVVFIGYTRDMVNLNTNLVVRKELTVTGSRNALHVFPAVIRMMEKREFRFENFITRIYPFHQARQALSDWDSSPGEFTKILIDMKPE